MSSLKKMYSVILTGTIAITGVGIGSSLVLKKNQYTYAGSTIAYTNSVIEEESKINFVDETADYSSLYDELNSIILEKGFSDNAKKIILQNFDMIYNNYDLYGEVYRFNNIASKEEYIQKTFIESLKKDINSINIIDFNLEENKSVERFSGYYVPEHKEIVIGMNGELDENIYDIFIHELTHVSQNNIFDMGLESNIFKIMTEGESVCSEILKRDRVYLTMSGLVYKQENSNTNNYYSIKGIYADDNIYTIYSKCYGMLLCIVDHNVLEEVKNSNDLSCIVDYINSNYDIDGTELLNKMSELCDNCKNDNDILICENLEYLEQSINKCFYKDIQSLDSSEEVINFMNMKRYYDMQFATENLTNLNNSYDFDLSDKDNTKLDPYGINDLLYEKIIEYKIMPEFSNDETKNRQIFNVIMLEATDYDSYFNYNEPISIIDMKCGLSKDENILILFNSKDEPILSYDFQNNKSIRKNDSIDVTNVVPIEIFKKVDTKIL